MSPRDVKILGVPLDLGGVHRGVDMGPNAIRVAGLDEGLAHLGHRVVDLGNVEIPVPESRDPGDVKARYLEEITVACNATRDRILEHHAPGHGLVVLGGDHSAAIGSVGGTASFYRARNERIGLIWVDAHTDMNTPETSPSGNIHGMPVACLIGEGPEALVRIAGAGPAVDPRNIALIAIRDIDPTEKELVRSSGVRVFTMREIDEYGVREVMSRAVQIACEGTVGFHFSFDMDGVDAEEAPGVGTPVRGGLSYREAHFLCELACESGRMLAMDMMEVDPVRDIRNRTAELGAELILSAFGKRIL